ncbi:iron-dependent peroxidase [Lysinibacillus telephonicus]|uniref:iron-dependent peroxidase n=1 Tax=Lysinibacillus telephonicus TaxID=1714840 RepID=UPI003BA1C4F5
MNYIWDLVIRAENAGFKKKDLRFSPAAVYSPYMELSYEDLNTKLIELHIEINPYYRFHSIFHGLLDINASGYEELKRTLFDIVSHLLAEIDVMQGMNKREFYIHFLIKDIESGAYGEEVKKSFFYFQRPEKEIIAINILRLHETGETVYLLKDTINKIFPKSTVYANCTKKDELLIYIGQKETEEAWAKINLILDLFLPVFFHIEIYWQYHFGIIDVEETMRIDRIALY